MRGIKEQDHDGAGWVDDVYQPHKNQERVEQALSAVQERFETAEQKRSATFDTAEGERERRSKELDQTKEEEWHSVWKR